jgi:hypothetical protein
MDIPDGHHVNRTSPHQPPSPPTRSPPTGDGYRHRRHGVPGRSPPRQPHQRPNALARQSRRLPQPRAARGQCRSLTAGRYSWPQADATRPVSTTATQPPPRCLVIASLAKTLSQRKRDLGGQRHPVAAPSCRTRRPSMARDAVARDTPARLAASSSIGPPTIVPPHAPSTPAITSLREIVTEPLRSVMSRVHPHGTTQVPGRLLRSQPWADHRPQAAQVVRPSRLNVEPTCGSGTADNGVDPVLTGHLTG